MSGTGRVSRYAANASAVGTCYEVAGACTGGGLMATAGGDVPQSGYHSRNSSSRRSSSSAPHLQQQVGPFCRPSHGLAFGHPRIDQMVHPRFGHRGRNPPSAAPRPRIVEEQVGVATEVTPQAGELTDVYSLASASAMYQGEPIGRDGQYDPR